MSVSRLSSSSRSTHSRERAIMRVVHSLDGVHHRQRRVLQRHQHQAQRRHLLVVLLVRGAAVGGAAEGRAVRPLLRGHLRLLGGGHALLAHEHHACVAQLVAAREVDEHAQRELVSLPRDAPRARAQRLLGHDCDVAAGGGGRGGGKRGFGLAAGPGGNAEPKASPPSPRAGGSGRRRR